MLVRLHKGHVLLKVALIVIFSQNVWKVLGIVPLIVISKSGNSTISDTFKSVTNSATFKVLVHVKLQFQLSAFVIVV